MSRVESILEGPKPAGYYLQQVLSGSRPTPSLSDVLPGPLPPPSTVTNIFPSLLHAPSVATDEFKVPSLGPVLHCPSTLVPPVVPLAVVNYASLKRWGAAGCALVAGALLYLACIRTGRPTPSTPGATDCDAGRHDVVAQPATPDATDYSATDRDAIDENTRPRARFIMFVLFFSTLCFPADFAGISE